MYHTYLSLVHCVLVLSLHTVQTLNEHIYCSLFHTHSHNNGSQVTKGHYHLST